MNCIHIRHYLMLCLMVGSPVYFDWSQCSKDSRQSQGLWPRGETSTKYWGLEVEGCWLVAGYVCVVACCQPLFGHCHRRNSYWSKLAVPPQSQTMSKDSGGPKKRRAWMARGVVEGEWVTDLAGWGSDPPHSPHAQELPRQFLPICFGSPFSTTCPPPPR